MSHPIVAVGAGSGLLPGSNASSAGRKAGDRRKPRTFVHPAATRAAESSLPVDAASGLDGGRPPSAPAVVTVEDTTIGTDASSDAPEKNTTPSPSDPVLPGPVLRRPNALPGAPGVVRSARRGRDAELVRIGDGCGNRSTDPRAAVRAAARDEEDTEGVARTALPALPALPALGVRDRSCDGSARPNDRLGGGRRDVDGDGVRAGDGNADGTDEEEGEGTTSEPRRPRGLFREGCRSDKLAWDLEDRSPDAGFSSSENAPNANPEAAEEVAEEETEEENAEEEEEAPVMGE